MSKFWYVTGQLTEVQRYINVPMRWCEQYPARERREFWLARTDGVDQDVKLIVHSRSMPARRGHEVCVLLLGELVVGLVNLNTGRQVNFIRADPPLLLHRCDGLVSVGIIASGAALALGWDVLVLVGAAPLGVLYLPVQVIRRLLARTWLRGHVDRGLEKALTAVSAEPPRLRRIK
ncbi:hypothetical protein [Zoogloea sp.]|uniref:hypothetical protein n=1 Tax=Zoogloea sp. TaxID=49181 RepID=UPI0025E097E1|nr:hypothetical protein [Zoogloea sp.]MCK6393074.1 hypothetical protein [Zoogloea sp.]MCK6408470.1 hypothetical protein [Thauera sp.]